ncbi:MAG: CoA transferase [Dehalococcoidia bacterium]|nr:CoA transferase [Dehalococcoidia bacterium]
METALSDVVILDLTHYLAGPYGAMLLADLGARVIKVEPPGPRAREGFGKYSFKGQDAYFLSTNRNKKGIVLDLKSEKGKQVFYDLVKKADVVFDNYRYGVTTKLGVDYETLNRVNPRIICCSITGFGASGPYRDRPAYDLVIQAISGGMSITGEPGRPPVRSGIAIADQGAGVISALGIMAALHQRERTGRGQKVETSLLESHVSLLVYEAAYYFVSGIVPGPIGSGHRTISAYGTYKTKDDYIVIANPEGYDIGFLFRAIGREDLITDPRFDTAEKRSINREDLKAILQEAFKARTAVEWLDILTRGNVPCAPVNSLDKGLSDPQVLARDMVITVDYAGGGQIRQVGNPIKLSETPSDVRKQFFSPPIQGQHSEEVLIDLLGYSKERVEELKKEKVI